jgi:hypothetical protein
MRRAELSELHFITSIDNLESILERGILSHDKAAKIPHKSVALEDVQDRRRGKRVPNGDLLHSYANLYMHARNPMMSYLTKNNHSDLVVIRVSTAVLDIDGAVITDGNSASDGTRFFPSPDGLASLDSALVFAKYWTDLVDGAYWPNKEKKRVRNAEVLVPSLVPSTYIGGCYTDTPAKRDRCREFDELPDVSVRRGIFFQ